MRRGEIMPECAYAQGEQQLSKPDGGFLLILHTRPLRGCLGCSPWAPLAEGRGSSDQKCLLICCRDAAAGSCSSPGYADWCSPRQLGAGEPCFAPAPPCQASTLPHAGTAAARPRMAQGQRRCCWEGRSAWCRLGLGVHA